MYLTIYVLSSGSAVELLYATYEMPVNFGRLQNPQRDTNLHKQGMAAITLSIL
jgi:hypothetical protein